MKRSIRSGAAPSPGGFYSQAVAAGPFIFLSGQLPMDTRGKLVGQSPAEQTRQALGNIEAVLSEAGAGLDHLVSVTVYVSDIAIWDEVNRAYREFLADVETPPARAVVPSGELHHGALVEIAATAYCPG
ncbi:MAG: RidA family protein [Bacillota bacterium]